MSILCQENMLPKLELPFDYSPMAKMYHGCAFPLGIISANAKTDITPWLIGKYINCMYVGWWNNKLSYYFDDSWMRNDGILILQRIHLTHSSFRNIYGNMDIVNLFRKMISLGFYPTDYYDEFYIPGKVLYGTSHYRHDFLLTGYDDEKSCFISAGYLSDNVFQRFEIPYDNMRQAFYQVSDTHIEKNGAIAPTARSFSTTSTEESTTP